MRRVRPQGGNLMVGRLCPNVSRASMPSSRRGTTLSVDALRLDSRANRRRSEDEAFLMEGRSQEVGLDHA